MMDLRSPLARARGLGSAKEGVAHWWAQRLTAIALVPLLLWFVIAVIAHIGVDHAQFRAFFGAPVPAVLTLLLIGAGFHHLQLGLQVVIEDYVHHEATKIALILAAKGAAIGFGVLGAVAVLKLAGV